MMTNLPNIVKHASAMEEAAVELRAAVFQYERVLQNIMDLDDVYEQNLLLSLAFGAKIPSGTSLERWSLGLTKMFEQFRDFHEALNNGN